jgi:RNA polymerase sigma factor FliA
MRERGAATESGASASNGPGTGAEDGAPSVPGAGGEERAASPSRAVSVQAGSGAEPRVERALGEDGRYSVAAKTATETSPDDPAFSLEQAGDEQERMMVEHLPIVRFLARRIHERLPQHVDMEDLVSAGVLGLMDAFTKFDPEKKVQFRSYAQFRIRGAILDSLRTLDWSPRDLRRKGRAVEEAMRSLTARYGRAATESEVAAELHLSLAGYQQLLGELKGLDIGTLHMERSEDSGEEELAYIPNRPDEDPLFRCLRGEMRQRLADAITELPERERLVMTLYYYEEMTMKEIGLTLGVVESRVSQIHASAVLHLRALLADLTASRGAKEKPAARGDERRASPSARSSRPL